LKGKLAVGFGGGHYSPKHTQLCLQEDYAVGHIFSKYVFDEVKQDVVAEAFRKTRGRCETAIVDWKGMRGSQRDTLLTMLRRVGVEDIIRA